MHKIPKQRKSICGQGKQNWLAVGLERNKAQHCFLVTGLHCDWLMTTQGFTLIHVHLVTWFWSVLSVKEIVHQWKEERKAAKTYLLQWMAGCFLLDSPIKIQYSTSCSERGPLLNGKYIHSLVSVLNELCCSKYVLIKNNRPPKIKTQRWLLLI